MTLDSYFIFICVGLSIYVCLVYLGPATYAAISTREGTGSYLLLRATVPLLRITSFIMGIDRPIGLCIRSYVLHPTTSYAIVAGCYQALYLS